MRTVRRMTASPSRPWRTATYGSPSSECGKRTTRSSSRPSRPPPRPGCFADTRRTCSSGLCRPTRPNARPSAARNPAPELVCSHDRSAKRSPSAASSAASPGPGRAGRPVRPLAASLQSGPARRRMALVPGPGLRACVHDTARGRGRARRGGGRPRIRVPLRQPADCPARPRPEPAGRTGQLRSRRRGRDPAAAPLGPADGARLGAAVRVGRRWRLAGRAPVPAPDTVRRDGPRVRPRRRLLRVHGAGDRGRDRSRHRRHDAHAARDHMLYGVRRDIVVFRRQVTVEPSARLHLAVLIALLFVLVALSVYFVRLPGLLYSTTGPLVGASFADLHARLAGLAAVAGGALVLWGAKSQRLARNTVLAVGLYLGVSLLGVALYPALIQKLVVAPNELVKETPQLAYHIAATRRAWGLVFFIATAPT